LQMDNVNGYPLVVIQLMLNGVAFGAEWRKELPCNNSTSDSKQIAFN
jgi:hypothetical protein